MKKRKKKDDVKNPLKNVKFIPAKYIGGSTDPNGFAGYYVPVESDNENESEAVKAGFTKKQAEYLEKLRSLIIWK